MIIKMRAEDVITELVETMLPRFSDDHALLLINLSVLAEKLKSDGRRKIVIRHIHLTFHRPHNYTKVLWNITKDPTKRPEDFTEWEVKSDHDSCWTTDGLESPLFQLGLAMTKEINQKLPPIDYNVLAHFSLFRKPRVVTIKGYQYDREKHKFTVQWK